MIRPFLILGCLALAGCSTPDTKPVTVKISGDSYCAIAQKITWSVADTRPTIDQIRRENAKVDKVCANTNAAKGN